VKSRAERARECAIAVDPEDAHKALIEHRREQAELPDIKTIAIGKVKRRAAITEGKQEMLTAVLKVLHDRRAFLPLSERQVHYALLNDPPLKHSKKPDSRYGNDEASYKNLIHLVTRARLSGAIPMEAIADPTRPVVTWNAAKDVGQFMATEMNRHLKGYWRNYQQSQPCHIELLGEKNTLASILQPVAMRYCVPMTIGRGFCSLPPRYDMQQRFLKSGREKLVLLIASDFDPDGEQIAQSFARSMRDDFGIQNIVPVKIAITPDQIAEYGLSANGLEAKVGSVNYRRFTDEHGLAVYEVEALEPQLLQELLTEAIESVMDMDAFNAELEQEKQDAAYLDGIRTQVLQATREIVGPDDQGGAK
jgi:hypothetical protein